MCPGVVIFTSLYQPPKSRNTIFINIIWSQPVIYIIVVIAIILHNSSWSKQKMKIIDSIELREVNRKSYLHIIRQSIARMSTSWWRGAMYCHMCIETAGGCVRGTYVTQTRHAVKRTKLRWNNLSHQRECKLLEIIRNAWFTLQDGQVYAAWVLFARIHHPDLCDTGITIGIINLWIVYINTY